MAPRKRKTFPSKKKSGSSRKKDNGALKMRGGRKKVQQNPIPLVDQNPIPAFVQNPIPVFEVLTHNHACISFYKNPNESSTYTIMVATTAV
jgi:hypothetical protein